ncbi:hypothetical protein CHCC20335_0433 [Bacillus paralicheniformis]|nr:hypothetical protein CHCC20335_0433 [Bacillus paralicheniformis]
MFIKKNRISHPDFGKCGLWHTILSASFAGEKSRAHFGGKDDKIRESMSF